MKDYRLKNGAGHCTDLFPRIPQADSYSPLLHAEENAVQVKPGVAFKVGDVEVTPFRVPHDPAEPVAFTVASGISRAPNIYGWFW